MALRSSVGEYVTCIGYPFKILYIHPTKVITGGLWYRYRLQVTSVEEYVTGIGYPVKILYIPLKSSLEVYDKGTGYPVQILYNPH